MDPSPLLWLDDIPSNLVQVVRVAPVDLDRLKDRVDHHFLEGHEHQDIQAVPVVLLLPLVRLVLVDP